MLVFNSLTPEDLRLRQLMGIALARSNQARLTVCAIVDTIPSEMQMAAIAITPREVLDIAVAEKRDWLNSIVEPFAADGVPHDAKVLVGKPFIEIIRQVLRNHHDLIIKCADADSGLREMLFSSTDKHLMRKCPCPVWLLKPRVPDSFRTILAAVDLDDAYRTVSKLNASNCSATIATNPNHHPLKTPGRPDP